MSESNMPKAKALYDEYRQEAPHFTFRRKNFIARVKRLARKMTVNDPAIMYLDALALRLDIDINKYLKVE